MHILFVDAGNYSRSPAAEAVTRRLLEERGLAGRVALASAGLKDKHAGGPADPRTVAACAIRGLDLSHFRCRKIAPADFDCDLILAMDQGNLDALTAMQPRGTRPGLDLFLSFAGGGDVPDPFYGGQEAFEDMLALVERGARSLVDALAARTAA